jgi:hypothetical protein
VLDGDIDLFLSSYLSQGKIVWLILGKEACP